MVKIIEAVQRYVIDDFALKYQNNIKNVQNQSKILHAYAYLLQIKIKFQSNEPSFCILEFLTEIYLYASQSSLPRT